MRPYDCLAGFNMNLDIENARDSRNPCARLSIDIQHCEPDAWIGFGSNEHFNFTVAVNLSNQAYLCVGHSFHLWLVNFYHQSAKWQSEAIKYVGSAYIAAHLFVLYAFYFLITLLTCPTDRIIPKYSLPPTRRSASGSGDLKRNWLLSLPI